MTRNSSTSGARTGLLEPLVGLLVASAFSASVTMSAQRAVPNVDSQPTHGEEVKRLLITDSHGHLR